MRRQAGSFADGGTFAIGSVARQVASASAYSQELVQAVLETGAAVRARRQALQYLGPVWYTNVEDALGERAVGQAQVGAG